MTDGFLPLDEIVVDGDIHLPATKLQGGSIFHDIDEGTLTVTFVNVRTVETVYKHMLSEEKSGRTLAEHRAEVAP